MGEITLDLTEASTVLIKTRNEDGSTSDHHFELVPITKPRLDAIAKVHKQMLELREKANAGTATRSDELAASATLAEALDMHLHPLGSVTVTELWDDGRVGVEDMRRVMTAIRAAAVDA
jgi:hypothetical protein